MKSLRALTLLVICLSSSASALPGDVDAVFNPNAGSGPSALAVQADGKIIIGGGFTMVGGVTRNRIARLNADGTLDAGFNPNASGGSIGCVAVQPDGKIVIAGSFTTMGGVARNRMARLNVDGTLDSGFDPDVNNGIYAMAVQADGKIIIGGDLTLVGGLPRNRLARLNTDGSVDAGFNPDVSSYVLSLCVQADGKILLGGFFSSVGGVTRIRLARLNSDGSLDSAFTANASTGLISEVRCIAEQGDGRIVVGGTFTSMAGVTRNRIARLNADGTLDSGFDPNAGSTVDTLAVQVDGKILIGGAFSTVGGVTRNRIARLNADGTLDTAFNPNASSSVSSIALQSNGGVLVGGGFTTIGGVARNRLARLENDPAPQSLSVPAVGRVEWLRGGSAPETPWAAFELSTDGGTVYSPLGSGTRISGGWELAGLSLPASGHIRARARTTGGNFSASSGRADSFIAFGLPAMAEMAVTGNGVSIVDDDATPASGNHTDFGSVAAVAGKIARTFTIQNLGGADLSLGAISLGGTHAADFSVTGTPVTPVPPGGSTTFQVTFDPGALGVRSATVSFTSDDADESPFDFSIQGTGVLSANADLGALTISTGILSPAFASGTTTYTASVNFNTASLTVTPTSADGSGTITVNGTAVASGSASGSIPLNVGSNFVTLLITAQDGITTQTYRVEVNRAATLAPGDADPSFDPTANSDIYAMAVQADGKILMGGNFTTVGGVVRNYIARLNADGSLDAGFNPNAANRVYSIVVQPDGKILIAGWFSTVGGVTRSRVARVNADGTLDPSFNPDVAGDVGGMAMQTDGKILIGGDFTAVGGVARNRIARLNADGTLDTGFNPDAGSTVSCLAVQADGKIVIGGIFTTVGGVTRNRIARLNTDGTLDTGFNPNASNAVLCVAVQPDGKIVIGGSFFTVGGGTHNYIARLNVNGTQDTGVSFHANNSVNSLAIQADGRVLFAGAFTTVGGLTRNRIAQFNASGTLDAGFDPNANSSISSVAQQADGRILLGGSFSAVGGLARSRIARLDNAPATRSLSVAGPSRVEWLRGGSSPETLEVTFELSTNGGMTYAGLGFGTRISGGWEIAGLSLPSVGHIRARARTLGGLSDGSAGIMETITGFSFLTPQESWRQTWFGTTGNSGDAADNFDYDNDGIANLLEYALGLNPTVNSAHLLPTAQLAGGNLEMSFNQPADVTGVTYGAEWSTTLAPLDWHPITDSDPSPTGHTFSVPMSSNTRLFMRLRVTNP